MSEKVKLELDSMFKDILTTPIQGNTARMYAILDRIRFASRKGAGSIVSNQTVVYEIRKSLYENGNYIHKAGIIDTTLSDPSQSDNQRPLQNSKRLGGILKKRIKTSADEEVLLITWDHGSGFGMFRDDPPQFPPKLITPIYEKQELRRFKFLRKFLNKALEHKKFKRYKANAKRISPHYFLETKEKLFKLTQLDGHAAFIQHVSHEKGANSFSLNQLSDTHALLTLNSKVFNELSEKKLQLVLSTDQVKGFQTEALSGKVQFNIALEDAGVPEILKNNEIAEAIKHWLGEGRQVDVLLMMNCWMMNIHTMYSLKDSVAYLVAPQGNIAIPGYNYKDILKFIFHAEHGIDGRQLAITCVETCENPYARRRAKKLNADNPNTIDSWKIIAVDLQAKDTDNKKLLEKQINSLKNIIDLLNLGLSTDIRPELRWMLKYVRSVSYDFTDRKSLLIDIVNWLQCVEYADVSLAGANAQLYGNVDTAISNFVSLVIRRPPQPTTILKRSTGKLVSSSKEDSLIPNSVINLQPTGYSLFFPICKFGIDKRLMDNIQSDSLLKESLSNWKNFLTNWIDNNIVF